MFKIISSSLVLLIIIEVLATSPSSAAHLRQKRYISPHELGNAVSDILARAGVKIGEIDKEANDASARVDSNNLNPIENSWRIIRHCLEKMVKTAVAEWKSTTCKIRNAQMSPEQKKVAKDEIIKNAETKKMEEKNKSKYDICILRKNNGQMDNGQTDCSSILNSQNTNGTGTSTATPLASSTQSTTRGNFQQPTQVTQSNFQQPQPTQARALQQPTQPSFQQLTPASFQQSTVINNGHQTSGPYGVVTTGNPLSTGVTQGYHGIGFTQTVPNTGTTDASYEE